MGGTLDLDLPDGDGLTLLGEIGEDVPVLIFSGYGVDPGVDRRAGRVMTKSRVEGPEVVQAILNVLAAPAVPKPHRVA